jgi:carbamoyl-phosphate synthase large subunit
MQVNVLITSVSRKVSLVKAFQVALQEEGGGQVLAVDVSPHSAALYLADWWSLIPRQTDPEFLPFLLKLCREKSVALLVPTRDEELPFFARHSASFEAAGTRVMVAPQEVIEVCQDKPLFVKFCERHGFSAPRTYTIEEARDANVHPLFLRPRAGKGGKGATIVRDHAHLEQILSQNRDVLIQEYVQAPEYTVDLFADFHGCVISAVPRERVSVFGGESFVSTTRKDQRLIDEAVRLAKSLKLVGHNTIQCFLKVDGTIAFIEINPRFGGAANLGFRAGAPSPQFLVQLMKGERLEPRLGRFEDGLTMLRYTDDLFMTSDEISRRTSA